MLHDRNVRIWMPNTSPSEQAGLVTMTPKHAWRIRYANLLQRLDSSGNNAQQATKFLVTKD